ncbi:PDZ domain-containing protein [Pseudoxanthomonas putridarboris]|uniref:PDZ domain-containing protein n=1 Tax=Pseudoxanthomonas putridarboris TaxID=752605 RepID=A0ABU9IX26_9GAMM
MKPTLLTSTLLAVALALPLAGHAQADATARQQELDAARQELQRAAKRVAELSRETAELPRAIQLDRLASRKPRLGVLLAGDDDAGVRITGITPDSGAAKAGLKSGDRLLRIAGKSIAGANADERLQNARAALADLKADTPVSLGYQRDGRMHEVHVTPTPVGPRIAFSGRSMGDPGTFTMLGDGEGMPWLEGVPLPLEELRLGIAPEVQRELRRLGKLEDCKGEDCRLPVLAEAFRWSNLNLASVDAQLGRYFGTDAGVLVLSTGDELEGLQAGDVIRKVEGKAVGSPREVMEALRGKPGDAKVSVEYLRDRQPRTSSITVPKAIPLRLPLAPRMAIQARPVTTTIAAPHVIGKRRTVIVDSDGNVQTFGEETDDPPPPPPGDGGAPL